MRDNPLVSPSEVNRHHYTLAFLGSGSERFAGSGSEVKLFSNKHKNISFFLLS